MSVFDQLYELAKRDSSGLQSMLKNFLDVDYDTQISDIENGLKKQITQAEDLRLNLESSELELKNIEDEIYALMKSMKPVDSDVGDIDALNLNLGNTEKQIDELKETKESLEDELKSVKEDSALLEHRIRSDKFSNIDKKVVP